jgi:hypothetical protein
LPTDFQALSFTSTTFHSGSEHEFLGCALTPTDYFKNEKCPRQ